MKTRAMYDFAQITLRNDLIETIESYLGPMEKGGWCCPFHDDSTPSLKVKRDKGLGKDVWRCFGCGAPDPVGGRAGDVVDFVSKINNIPVMEAADLLGGYKIDLGLSPVEVEAKRKELLAQRQAMAKKRREETLAKQRTALDRVSGMMARVEAYHANLSKANGYWKHSGISEESVEFYKLGYCDSCPTDRNNRASYVIPVMIDGKLVSIRHRIVGNDSDKYRPEFAGLPPMIFLPRNWFNDDIDDFGFSWGGLPKGEGVLVEGEKKSIVLDQLGIRTAGLPGVQTWNPDWLIHFKHIKKIYICLDFGAVDEAYKIAEDFAASGKEVFIVDLPSKPDDFFITHGFSLDDFGTYLNYSRSYKGMRG